MGKYEEIQKVKHIKKSRRAKQKQLAKDRIKLVCKCNKDKAVRHDRA